MTATGACSACGGELVSVSLRDADYLICGDMTCDLARIPPTRGGVSPEQAERAGKFVQMHNEARAKRIKQP